MHHLCSGRYGSDNIEKSDDEDLEAKNKAEHLAAVEKAIKVRGKLDHTVAHGVLQDQQALVRVL